MEKMDYFELERFNKGVQRALDGKTNPLGFNDIIMPVRGDEAQIEGFNAGLIAKVNAEALARELKKTQ